MTDFLEALRSMTTDENIKINEPMKNHTSFKIGGPADVLVTPGSIEELHNIIKGCRKFDIPVTVMGNGSNLIVRDKGIRGLVIKIQDKLNKFTVDGETIEAEAGILLSRLSNIALQNELGGLEFALGIPGTLGGAVAMNAGAYDGSIRNVVIETQYIDNNFEIKVLNGEEHKFGYRTSLIQDEGGVVLKSKLQLAKKNREEIKSRMDELTSLRKSKQPLHLPSAGSVFKRPEGCFAGKLIEDAGLKGYKIGGAEVSALHAGFIVNNNNATAQDVIDLIKYIQRVVNDKFGVKLQTEVKIIGEE